MINSHINQQTKTRAWKGTLFRVHLILLFKWYVTFRIFPVVWKGALLAHYLWIFLNRWRWPGEQRRRYERLEDRVAGAEVPGVSLAESGLHSRCLISSQKNTLKAKRGFRSDRFETRKMGCAKKWIGVDIQNVEILFRLVRRSENSHFLTLIQYLWLLKKQTAILWHKGRGRVRSHEAFEQFGEVRWLQHKSKFSGFPCCGFYYAIFQNDIVVVRKPWWLCTIG